MRIASEPVSRKNLLCAVAVAALAFTGCADVPDAAQSETAEQTEVQEVKSTEQALQANGVTFAQVVANGNGCPLNSTSSSISPDGKVFTLTFSKYFTHFSPNTTPSVPSCNIAVKLQTPPGLSYAISELSYSGYAVLPSNSSAKLTASYSYQGVASAALDSSKKTIVGPYDDSFIFKDTIKTNDLTWSPCGAVRDLNIRTFLSVSNPGRGEGDVSVMALDGAIPQSGLVVKFASKSCK